MDEKRWRLRIQPAGMTGWDRMCTSADNAKAWAKGTHRTLLDGSGFSGATATIYDPAGREYARALMVRGGSWRLKWKKP